MRVAQNYFTTILNLTSPTKMAKYVAELVVIGAQIVGRAFVKALRDEIAASQQAARVYRSANVSRKAPANTYEDFSVSEAMQILNIDKLDAANAKELQKRFDHLFNINAESRGGSFYIQSKIFRAKERIEEEFKRSLEQTKHHKID